MHHIPELVAGAHLLSGQSQGLPFLGSDGGEDDAAVDLVARVPKAALDPGLQFVLILEDDLPREESIQAYSKRLEIHQNFNSFINAIWWFKGDYKKALVEIGQFISYMIRKEDDIFVEQNIIRLYLTNIK